MKSPILVAAITLTLFSCRKEINTKQQENITSTENSEASLSHPIHSKWESFVAKIKAKNNSRFKTDSYYRKFFEDPESENLVECQISALNTIVQQYLIPFQEWDYFLFPDYIWINQVSAIIDRSKQFFGRDGEYTQLVTKHERKLTTFWNLKNTIRVNGEHSETLGNRDKIAEVFILFTDASREDAYYVADQIIAMNKESKVFPHTPLLSFDGFSTSDHLIVLGDGLIQGITETGVVDEVAVAGLLSHEWGHQVQFENSLKWYGVTPEEWQFSPKFTRQIEMEADFFSSYYLTHKRGATYNWKRVAEFNELFFNIGDCDFTSAAHHGTPTQRQNAAKLGYTVASQTKPMGHILSPDQLHSIFMQKLRDYYLTK
ncbi:MAG: hypothetical protein J7497_03675 [Chitinophagaceae bacterium]|nr:hypothetical protein [Chitinophagaceae bacterium]